MKSNISLGLIAGIFSHAAMAEFADNIDYTGKISLRAIDQYDYSAPVLETDGFKQDVLLRNIIKGSQQISENNGGWNLIGYAEFDFKAVTNGETDNSILFRYMYLGFQNDTFGEITYGKNWSYGSSRPGESIDRFYYYGREFDQSLYRNKDTLNYEKSFGDIRLNISSNLFDDYIDNTDDQYTGHGQSIALSSGINPWYGDEEGIGWGVSAHNAQLGWGLGTKESEHLYKDDGDLTVTAGLHGRYKNLLLGAVIAKSDLNKNGDNLDDFTWDVVAKYDYGNSYIAVGHGVTYAFAADYAINSVGDNDFISEDVTNFTLGHMVWDQFLVYWESRFSKQKDDQHILALEYYFG